MMMKSILLNIEYLEKFPDAVTTVLPTEEPEYSISMGYEHLNTILETESDKVTESGAKNLLPILIEYEVTSDDENECDVPVKDESSSVFRTFSNPLFDDNDDFTSSDDESISNEDVPTEDFKVYSNPLFDDEETNSDELDPHYFNAESDLIKSLSNLDTLFDSSPKFDYLEEFSELLSNDTPPIPENESSNFDYHDNPSFPRPLPEPPDVEIFFKSDSGVLTTNVVKGIFEHYVLMPNILSTLPTFDPLYPVYDTLLLFSSENKDKVFKPEIPSGESKVHIEVLSVLWRNRLLDHGRLAYR
nr:hypothetical protein [Tanacetum cinerariifolium]